MRTLSLSLVAFPNRKSGVHFCWKRSSRAENGDRPMPKLPSFPVAGGCICGAVRYEVSDRPLGVYNCHCKDCQRSAGSAYSASMIVRRETFSLKGDTQTYDKLAASGRTVRQH